MDGYLRFLFNIKTYYIMGEWFTGAIIIIYFLYPIILYIFNNYIYVLNIVLISLYVLMIKTKFFLITIRINPITCIISFCFGMLYIRNKKIFTSRIILTTSLIINLYLSFVKLNKTSILLYQIQSFSFLIILINIGEFIMKTKAKYFFQEIRIKRILIFYCCSLFNSLSEGGKYASNHIF